MSPDSSSNDGSSATNDEFPPGFQIASFHIVEAIGHGGSSIVYTAENRDTGEIVALKVLKRGLASSTRQVRRLVQEARAVQRIKNPAITNIYDVGNLEDGRPYLVMELIDGISLDELLTMRGRLPLDEAIELLAPICMALEQAHKAGIVHRDIKAKNVMLVLTDDDRREVKLLDFGIAKLLDVDASDAIQTSAGVVLGSLHAIAPEQIQKRPIDGRTDIYALGVLLYKILTGYHPFRSNNDVALLQMHLHAEPPPVSSAAPAPTSVDTVIAKAMAKDPDRRYQSASAFLAALRAAVTQSDGVEQQSEAWAIYVRGCYPTELELSDELLYSLLDVVDISAFELQSAGLQLLFQTDHSLLAAVADQGDDRSREHLFELASRLYDTLQQRTGADDTVHVAIGVHRDKAATREFGKDSEITGGAIANIQRWAAPSPPPGVYVTRKAISSAEAGVHDSPDTGPSDPGDTGEHGDPDPDTEPFIPLNSWRDDRS